MRDYLTVLPTSRLAQLCSAFGVIATVANLASLSITAAPVAPPLGAQARNVSLASTETTDFSLGSGNAFVMGGSGIPTPSPGYLNTVDTLYLEPLGFSGTVRSLFTPETTATHLLSSSETTGAQLLVNAIQGEIAGGYVDAANPVVVFGYSQSSALSTLAMRQLSAEGVPNDDVHFVLVGDSAAPNGGFLAYFPGGEELGYPTPDLYPTDVYTLEYDGFADFPRYSLNLLSDLNAFAGIVFEHLTYLGLDPERVANAIPLETVGDTVSHYYMIPAQGLPLLDLVRLLPVVGNPLADLLQPDMTVLVNLGYGSITEGWNQGPANLAAPAELFPPNLNWADVFTALGNGLPQGIQAAIHDLQDPANYQLTSLLDNPVLSAIFNAGYQIGALHVTPAAEEPFSSASAASGAFEDLTGLFSGVYP